MPCPRLASFDWIGKIKYFEIELCKTSVYQAIDLLFQQTAERVKLAFAVIALKIQKQPIISLADLIPTTKLHYKRKLRA